MITVLKGRLIESNRQHWGEFAALIASASATTAVIAVGGVVARDHPLTVKVLMSILVLTSLVATVVAYLGILNGTLLNVGPLSPLQIVFSLALAGAQVGAVLLVATTATADPMNFAGERAYVVALRHFLLLHVLLAAFAVLANRESAIERARWSDVVEQELGVEQDVLNQFNNMQHAELVAARWGGSIMAVAWGISLLWANPWLVAAAATTEAIAMSVQVGRQGKSQRQLWKAQFRE